MKKFITCLVACFALVQSANAATTILTESLLEYEAITSAIGTDPNFQNIIPSTEFIVDIKRLTRRIDDLGEVRYGILTRILNNNNGSNCDCHKKHHHTNRYVATLNVASNPALGPKIITVVSIVLLNENDDEHHH
ncbi:MAG: hypothetical protein H0X29_11780 [Parachlamydiaceae bacterium]|nr:hypothetical protein [Parachlamydiaceae bacterium]